MAVQSTMTEAGSSAPDLVQFGDFTLDLRAGELWRGGRDKVLLPDQPFRVLRTLVGRPGELVTREDLRRELWADDTFVDFEHGLNSAIRRLREALGESATNRYIETLPRRGYRFVAAVAVLNTARPLSRSASDSVSAPAVEQDARRRRAMRWPASVVVAVAITVAVALLAARALRVGQSAVPVVAVLPFANLSGEPDSDVFADGLTDEIIRHLAVIDGLQVRSRTSSFTFKGRPRSIRDVGDQLGATFVLEGSVLATGGKKRITAQLVEVAGDVPRWAGQFDREIRSSGDLFVILDEISRTIVNKLRLTLGRGQRRYDLDLDTYELYLKGRQLVASRSVPALEKAAQLFEEVLAKDSGFAPAQAGLAIAYALMSEPTSSALSFDAAHAVIRPAALAARTIDPLLAEAHEAMGWVYARESDWANAERAFRRAIDLDGSLTSTYTNYSISTLQPLGKLDEALRLLQVAAQNDPLSLEVQREIGHVHLIAGRYEDAIRTFHRVRAVDPQFPFVDTHLFRALISAGRIAEAESVLERLDGRSLGRFKATRRAPWLAQAFVRSGRRAAAEALGAEFTDAPSGQAFVYAALEDRERTVQALERMAAVEPHHVPRMLIQPEMRLVRDDPRIAALRSRFNLSPQ